MKKILFMILSLLCIQVYGEEENIKNQIGEKLKIDVKFTLPKEIIKYVVYASKDEGATKEDRLNLPDFIMSQEKNKSGFIETVPKVYTKRVIDGKIAELDPYEEGSLTYKLSHADGYMGNVSNDTIGNGGTSYRQITSYLSKATLENIIRNSGIEGYSISQNGSIKKGETVYFPANQINMKNNKGVLETTSPINNSSNPIPQEDIAKIEGYIGSGQPLGNVSLEVNIN